MIPMGRFGVILLTISSAVLSLSSCCEKKLYCGAKPLDFAFTGFPRSEVRSFILKRFAIGDRWGKPLDSAQYVYYGNAPVSLKPDTIMFSDYRTAGDPLSITQGNDWEIYLPASGTSYVITTIFDDNRQSQMVRCNDDETSCARNITNFSLNNEWQGGGFAYIQKKE